MPLHLVQDSVRRFGVDGGLQKSHRDTRFTPSAVEPVDEFIDIFLHVLTRHTTKGSKQKRFQIADRNVYLRQPVGDLSSWCLIRVIFMTFGNHPQFCERVGPDNRISAQL